MLEMPRYISHKEVSALQIIDIRLCPEGYELCFYDRRFNPIRVSLGWITKHDPRIGGYYVVYADGYSSWSPASAFEEGYTRIDGEERSDEPILKDPHA